MISTSLSARRL